MVEMTLDLIKRSKAEGLVYRYIERNRSVSSTMEGPERILERARDGLGIVVIKDGRKAVVSLANPSEEDIKNGVKKALDLAKFMEPDDGNVVSDEKDYEEIPGLYDESVEKVDLADLKEMSLSMVDEARKFDERVKFVRSASVGISVVEEVVGTTKGVLKRVKFSEASASIMCSAVDQSGGSMGYKMKGGRNLKELSPLEVARLAAKSAVEGLGAEVEKTGIYDIVFDPDAIAMIFFYAYIPFSGENIYKRASFLKPEDIGKKLFSENLTLMNDPRDPEKLGSIPFDSEGTNTRKFAIVENGVLKSFLHNLYSARKLNMKPTGNAFVRSFKSSPGISPVNLHLVANSKREEIISSVDKGIYVENVMGVHTSDPVSGRFSIQISGKLIENGEFVKPIRGMALSGTLSELLSAIEMVANDYNHYGPVSGSTVLVRGMSVGGK